MSKLPAHLSRRFQQQSDQQDAANTNAHTGNAYPDPNAQPRHEQQYGNPAKTPGHPYGDNATNTGAQAKRDIGREKEQGSASTTASKQAAPAPAQTKKPLRKSSSSKIDPDQIPRPIVLSADTVKTVSYTHLTLPTIYSV
eukprot:TRINITY_DN23397_c0_g1_i1.p2 TRINITY_DN23397_c0_g1~~TRINITY_DN23397_c0_g1_i1.p2  ORF type:complete len:140 (+),score=37.58 TRINITY_DN23397_c0_g1_i1:107-526(+)